MAKVRVIVDAEHRLLTTRQNGSVSGTCSCGEVFPKAKDEGIVYAAFTTHIQGGKEDSGNGIAA